MVFVCRGQPPFRVLLACGRSCCYGLSHFLQLTFSCWHSRVCFHSTSYISCFTPLLPTARKSCHSFTHCVPFHSFHFQGICLFPPTNPCGCSRVPFHSTPLHHRTHTPFPFIRFFPLHSFISSSPCFFQRTVRAKKMCQTSCRQHPSTALRASCVRGTRSTRSGSHTTHRLHTSFRFSTLAFALLSTLAQGCFYYSV